MFYMQLIDLVSEDGITTSLKGETKKSVLIELVKLFEHSSGIENTGSILSLIEEREELNSTGIGNGIAFPHCRSKFVLNLRIVIGKKIDGVDFDALDGQPVYLFFLLIAPMDSPIVHLKALAQLSKLAKDSNVREKLIKMKTSAEFYEFIKALKLAY